MRPPLDPRYLPDPTEPTRQSLLVSYALVASILPVLWFVSYPMLGSVLVVTTAGVGIVLRRVWRLRRCFRDCGGFSLDLAGRVRIAVTQTDADCRR